MAKKSRSRIVAAGKQRRRNSSHSKATDGAVLSNGRRQCTMAPHFYLSFLAVDPLKKGTGAGGALLQHRLPLLDSKVALWTGNEANVTFYEKYGFKLHAKCPFDVGACAWWFVKE